jgi:hypothetical protein
VAPELALVFDAAPGDADLDPAPVEVAAAAGIVVALVGVQLLGSAARSSGSVAMPADAGDGVEQRLEQLAVVGVGRREKHVERQPLVINQQVVLGAGFAPVNRVRAGQLAPLLARTDTASTLARDQSSTSAAESSSSTRRWSWSQTPAACH